MQIALFFFALFCLNIELATHPQAQARAHRIGQTKAVMVYRLLSKKTYEMHMFHQASLKV